MAYSFVINRLKAMFMFLFGIIKTALCCFRRRRKQSFDAIPLTTVGVVPNSATANGDSSGAELHSWNSWGDNPAAVVSQKDPIQQQIEQYRQQAARSNSTGNDEEAVQPNFFEDMTPQITKQTKILLRTNDAKPAGWGETVSSRLTLAVDPVLCSSPDLGTWEDSPGWEDQTQEDWDPDAILREKRRLERQRRLTAQQQKKQEKELSKVGRAPALGARIS
ncbi:receptor-binding cancer antigen expressed on SiSo cells [Bacillus rossius redtenbacheri]|uniref:receptor-binding cancer antigen expressed on SiSo cells n=1 Tax=Bacillus rossius redtenbacheri TaxID=93214 RepID=UPI002FDDE854